MTSPLALVPGAGLGAGGGKRPYMLTPAKNGSAKTEPANVRWLRSEIGVGALNWLFLRDGKVVRVICIGEDGFIEPLHDDEDNGPSVVAPINGRELSTRLADNFYCYTERTDASGRNQQSEEWFPTSDCDRALKAVDQLPYLRVLRGVTHTPILRGDTGTGVLTTPGFDEATGMLYQPDVTVPVIQDRIGPLELERAVSTVRGLLADFAFVGPHDEANYIGMMLTPLMRLVAPPPYKLGAIGAHQRGSGKSMLAEILRVLHGGTLRTWPGSDEELGKQIMSVLSMTTAPVCQIDNVRGLVRSAKLEAMLTSLKMTDRVLGSNNDTTVVNDRLWVMTGNNMSLGGDLDRRVVWTVINPGIERPEDRTDFQIPQLVQHVTAHRGEILGALLTMLVAWDNAGRPMPPASADSFGHWVACVRGILKHAGVPGVFDHVESRRVVDDPIESDFADFLAVVHEAYGNREFLLKDLCRRMVTSDFNHVNGGGDRHAYPLYEALPTEIKSKLKLGDGPSMLARPLGYFLRNRAGAFFGGLAVVPGKKGDQGIPWRIELPNGPKDTRRD